MVQSTIKSIFCALMLTIPIWSLIAKDTLHISSNKTALIDKSKGTLLLKENVIILQQSSQSTLKTDELLVKRDAATDQVISAVANGHVEMHYRPDLLNTNSKNKPFSPEVRDSKDFITTARKASFDKYKGLIILSGLVNIKSSSYEIAADQVIYHFRSQDGKISALPGKQVFMTYYQYSNRADPIPATNHYGHKSSAAADSVLFNKSGRKVTLRGNVKINDTRNQVDLTVDRAELFFDDNDELEMMITNGQFKMEQPKRFSKADRAVFEYRKEEVTLSGNAYVKEQDKIEINSSMIKMHINAEKGIIKGAEKVPVKMKVTID